jgi:hypothetical protein
MAEPDSHLLSLYDVNIGARWYWDYKGIKLAPGDSIVVAGFNVQGRKP